MAADATPEDPEDGDAELERAALSGAPGGGAAAVAAPASGRGPGRFIGFLRASWAELQRVQWPDRRQVGQATAVVIGFVIVAGAYLGVADNLAQRLVDFILK